MESCKSPLDLQGEETPGIRFVVDGTTRQELDRVLAAADYDAPLAKVDGTNDPAATEYSSVPIILDTTSIQGPVKVYVDTLPTVAIPLRNLVSIEAYGSGKIWRASA